MNKRTSLKVFVMGMLCFFVSQMVIRIPLLNYLNSNFLYSIFSTKHQILMGIFIPLSAGVFEECGRYIFKDKCLKSKGEFFEPIVFGLGHGLMEVAMILVSSVGVGKISTVELTIGLYERVLAVIFHICMSVLVWRGFILDRKIKHLLIAIFIHFIFDYWIVLVNQFKINMFNMYLMWSVVDLLLIVYIFKVKENWRSE